MTRDFYSPPMRRLQDERDGRRVADALEKHRLHQSFWDDEREMIAAAPFFFIATTDGSYTDCSMRSGDPGFVRLIGENQLEWTEFDGNSMYRTLGNISANPHVGLLFVSFDGKSRRIRISGRAEILSRPGPGRVGETDMAVRVTCDEIYPNCPRYLPDIAGAAPSPNVPRDGHRPPPPEWKTRDYIRDILPEGDPFAGDGKG
ncbi:pyridoxamine 5'-phosphate oxidase family protein [Pseudooceanicola sp. C21-150M6]|uniref:pyridoxamine 5'-phosphate oxidase family protein n=1 Tax=Pseudooceanicola sp. C21-150M6 TaxID=3434355 RepID=UPI003D7F9EF2